MNIVVNNVMNVMRHFLPTIHLFPKHLLGLAEYLQVYVFLLFLGVVRDLNLIHVHPCHALLLLRPLFQYVLLHMLVDSRRTNNRIGVHIGSVPFIILIAL